MIGFGGASLRGIAALKRAGVAEQLSAAELLAEKPSFCFGVRRRMDEAQIGRGFARDSVDCSVRDA